MPCTQLDRERSLRDRTLAIKVGHLRRGLSKASFGACAPGSKHSCHVRGVCSIVPIDTGAGGSEVQQSLVRACAPYCERFPVLGSPNHWEIVSR